MTRRGGNGLTNLGFTFCTFQLSSGIFAPNGGCGIPRQQIISQPGPSRLAGLGEDASTASAAPNQLARGGEVCKMESAASGRVAEWLKAPDSKSGLGETLTWVRIPPLPPLLVQNPAATLSLRRHYTVDNGLERKLKSQNSPIKCFDKFSRRREWFILDNNEVLRLIQLLELKSELYCNGYNPPASVHQVITGSTGKTAVCR